MVFLFLIYKCGANPRPPGAWAAGKSVASEKPVAGDVETATELFALFTEKYDTRQQWLPLIAILTSDLLQKNPLVLRGTSSRTSFTSRLTLRLAISSPAAQLERQVPLVFGNSPYN